MNYWIPRIVLTESRHKWNAILCAKTSGFNKLRFSKSVSICLIWNSAIILVRIPSWCRGRFLICPVGYFERSVFHSILPSPREISKRQQFLVNWHCAWHFIFHAVPTTLIDPWHLRTGTFNVNTDPVSLVRHMLQRNTLSWTGKFHSSRDPLVHWYCLYKQLYVSYHRSFHPLSRLEHPYINVDSLDIFMDTRDYVLARNLDFT